MDAHCPTSNIHKDSGMHGEELLETSQAWGCAGLGTLKQNISQLCDHQLVCGGLVTPLCVPGSKCHVVGGRENDCWVDLSGAWLLAVEGFQRAG